MYGITKAYRLIKNGKLLGSSGTVGVERMVGGHRSRGVCPLCLHPTLAPLLSLLFLFPGCDGVSCSVMSSPP